MRLGRASRVYLPARAFALDSIDGVADPSRATAPSSRARITATSRPW